MSTKFVFLKLFAINQFCCSFVFAIISLDEFVANLLSNPFEVFIPEIDVYEVLFNPANGMLPDPECSYFGYRITKGVFATTIFDL